MLVVTHLITGLGKGGAEKQLTQLVCSSSKKVHHHVISMTNEGIHGDDLKKCGVSVTCLHMTPGRLSLKGLWRLWRCLRIQKPNILQTWLYHADLLGLIVGRLSKVPHIAWNIRWSHSDMGHYSRLSAMVLKFNTFLSRCPDAVITNSHAGRAHHMTLGYNPRRWVYIPNGFDSSFFEPSVNARLAVRTALKIKQDGLVVGMVARNDPMKDYNTLLHAMYEVMLAKPRVHLIVAGSYTQLLESALPISLKNRIHCLGDRSDIPDILASLDLFVLSSAFGEGFPNVLGEAMLTEIPCIATDVGDCNVLLDPEFLVPASDTYALQEKIKYMLNQSLEERHVIGANSRQKILSRYSLKTCRTKYTQLYESLLPKKATS